MPLRLSYNLFRNYVDGFINVKLKRDPLKPLFFTVYTNLLCNLNCVYCDYAQNGHTRKFDGQLDTEYMFKLLKIIRKSCSNIYFTGGEPLLRKDIIEILKKSKELKFKSIVINTNMSLIHKKLEVLDYITDLVASFDIVDEEKNSKLLGVSKTVAYQVKENIIACAKLQKKKNFNMTINCVVTNETISESYRVLEFCINHKIKFAIVPAESQNGEINKDLIDIFYYQSDLC